MNMKILNIVLIIMVLSGLLQGCGDVNSAAKGNHDRALSNNDEISYLRAVAAKPPMGWNSFDAYDCRINESEFKATVDYMAENLLEYGWEYAVIDYIWWHPEPGNWDTPRRFGHPNLRYEPDGAPSFPEYTTMDEYGRLMPAINRFPSAANGKGFKPIADYVHSKGMKFGLHIMRGIHRMAVYNDTPVLGTSIGAKSIAEPTDTCAWCNQMYGVDASKPGSQEYYDSLFKLYASWGVDYIKADDMIFLDYHKKELEMMRKAIDKCGRPMVLSLSPGEAPLSQAKHLVENANMWRISGDFWDNWESLKHNFDLLNSWSSYIQPHHWPDADMLPIGHISLNNRPHGPDRMSNFTIPEHYTMMTLWSIAKSPLMMGGDLLTTPDSIMNFLKNREVLEVNQKSVDNRQVLRNDTIAIWIATDPDTEDRFLALFNLSDIKREVNFNFAFEYLRGKYQIRDLWEQKDIGEFKHFFKAPMEPHGAGLYRLTKWVEKETKVN